ncbi:MAG: NAD(+) diphosphatase [Methanobacteriaceae archaeon]|jgi:NAD+ diphosphatase|uniref:NAD(+) diphosphatase n=1 Tax=Methanobrevibacter TaxID=2172 RepID=UPI00375FA53A|nr:NAD(+) diphosphatase [Methanobacteriaceae archaeon]MDD4594314.1 NAD(+) diphosphatase [Methanobacteriaceae archaeon]
MIESSIYDNYKIDFSDNFETNDESYYFIYNTNRELYLNENLNVPQYKDELSDFCINFLLYIGTFKDKPCFVVNVDNNTNTNFYSLLEIYNMNPILYQMAGRGVLINDWYNSYKYCGHCGCKTVLDEKDMMMKCPSCGQVHYTRIAPAIIVAINNNGKLLMAKHSYHKNINYALIAGFVEAGESIEEAVHREVLEEVGIKIKNLKYMRSQSWPFPNSLMLGFTADYESGEIKVDHDEILKAKWFNVKDIELPPYDISISSWLMEDFIKKSEN